MTDSHYMTTGHVYQLLVLHIKPPPQKRLKLFHVKRNEVNYRRKVKGERLKSKGDRLKKFYDLCFRFYVTPNT